MKLRSTRSCSRYGSARSNPRRLCRAAPLALALALAGPQLHAEALADARPADASIRLADDATERAKQLFERGAQAFAQRRNVEAVYYFRRAAELVPSAEFTYNIGLAYEDMGDIGQALSAYRRYLREQPASEHQGEVQQRVTQLEARLASVGLQQLSVRSEPLGATVFVNDSAVGITPWAGELVPGTYRVQVRAPGYRNAEAEVALAAERAADFNLVLTPVYFDGSFASAPGRDGAPSSPPERTLAWALLGTGAAAFLGGIVFEASRASSQSASDDAATPEAAARAQGAADGKQMASMVLLGVGGGLLVSGTLLITLGQPSEPSAAPERLPSATPATPAQKLLPAAPQRPRAAALSLGCFAGFCGAMARGAF